MPAVAKRTVSLPEDHAAYIDRVVASGAYACASEVVRAGLRALQERDAAVERWLNTEVAAADDAMTDDPRGRATSVMSLAQSVRAIQAVSRGAIEGTPRRPFAGGADRSRDDP